MAGRWWGVLLLGVGLCLFLCLFSYNAREVGWSALNKSGVILEGTTNYQGVVGLYIAALTYWLLGAGAWVLIVLIYWLGIYRLANQGRLPDRILYWGLGGVVAACVLLGTQLWFGQQWAEQNSLYGPGGALGHLLGPVSLQKLLTTGGLIALCGLVYMIALIYVCGSRPKPFFKGVMREWRAWRDRRRAGKGRSVLASEPPRERPRFNDRFGKPKVPAEEAESASKFKAPKREPSPRKKRTGDSLSELDAANQAELELKYAPKIIDASRTKPAAAPDDPPATGSPFAAENTEGYEHYVLPGLDLLNYEEAPPEQTESEKNELYATQQVIIDTLKSFGVEVTPGNITKGPTITRFEIYPTAGLRVSKITNLEQDLARATKAVRINILAPIPGRDTVGIEIANKKKVPVVLRDLLDDPEFKSPGKRIPLALGKDVYGRTVIGDLAAMPHLLVAGTTGSGKSVCINSIITSMLFKFRPDELKLILVDPKVVEMQPYAKLPHLQVPVVTDPKKVITALRLCVNEMERRYRIFAEVGVRNFEAFNKRPRDEKRPATPEPEDEEVDEELIESIAADFESQGENPASVWDDEDEEEQDAPDDSIPDKFPYIVIIIDELADLMQTAPADMESYIGRLTQKARAAGIHLIVATQTPRSDVVTGLIKANIPCRIAFQVSSALDSRIILDQNGAEKLVGKGDLLYLPPGSGKYDRAQGAYISDPEVEGIVSHCAVQADQTFDKSFHESIEGDGPAEDDDVDQADEETYQNCLEVVLIERKASTSLLQRRLRIGYGKAARMMDLLEKRGVIGPADGTNRPRDVLLD